MAFIYLFIFYTFLHVNGNIYQLAGFVLFACVI